MTKSDVAAILIVIAVLFAFPGAAASQTATGATGITASGWHTCALTTGGGVLCWGYNGYGELGDGTTTDQWTPTAVSGLSSGVTAVAAGGDHTCALTAGGGVLCWGYNGDGEVGDGTTTDRWTPTPVTGLGSGVVAIAAGVVHTCALTGAGAVYCWGGNGNGEVGDGTTTTRLTPVQVTGLGSGVAAIAAGGWHTCAVTAAGGASCWGYNGYGELGDGTTTDRWTPTAVSGLASGVAAVTAGLDHTCALTIAGAMACWGWNAYGQLGDGTQLNRLVPVGVTGLGAGVAAIAAGAYHSCAVTAAGAALCWGQNDWGQLGDGTATSRTTPTAVSGLGSGVASMAAGMVHTCALTSDGGVACWGENSYGQLGNGTTTQEFTPIPVTGLWPLGPAPTVAAVAPTSGPASGGTAATITGTGFVAGASVSFGGVAATNVTVVSATQITVTVPPHAPGTVDVVVVNADLQQATLAGGYEYLAVVPVDLAGTGTSSIAVFRPSTGQWWIDGQSQPVTFGQAGDIPVVADYNGDGKADLAVYRPSASEWIVQGQSPVMFGQAGDVPVPGDYNGDGKAEMAVFRPSTGDWIVDGQTTPTQWGMRGDIPAPADYNGDGITDLAVFRPTTGFWYVMNGATMQWGMWGDVPVAADYNGDGKAEIAVYRPATGWWYVSGGPTAQWGDPGDVPVPLDVDGDGRIEFVVFRPDTGTWYSLNPTTSATTATAWGQAGDVPVGQAPQLPATPVLKTAGDFDHDGVADVTVFRPSTGVWYTLESTFAYHASAAVTLGQDGDVPVPGDYQGTGQQERAVYRPATGQWLLEDGRTFTLGQPGDIPVPADYDGDGIMDLGVFTPATATWTGLTSSSGFTATQTLAWGAPGDTPVPGDYDGDGKADLAVFTPATGMWSILSSKTGTPLMTVQWGMDGDIPVQADYDGDGLTDIGVFRPSTGYWYGLMSKDGYATASYQAAQWGAPGDIPVPGDYNGDGKTEVAVYRPSTGTWYVMDVMSIAGWGDPTDVPILGRW